MTFTDEELRQALKVANKFALKWSHTSLGAEDYASTAIEKLLTQREKPDNIEAWLKLVITNMMIDRNRKLKARKPSLRDLAPEEIQAMAVGRNDRTMSSLIAIKDQVADILDQLPEKEQQLLVLDAAGFTTTEIATELNYASAKVVATRIKQVRAKVLETIRSR